MLTFILNPAQKEPSQAPDFIFESPYLLRMDPNPGPETAARLLSRVHKNEHDFFYDLLVAQKTFIRTKSFWKR